MKKAVANYTKFKVYSKVDAESIINSVLASDYMSFKEKYGFLANKTKNEVIEMLWRGLNTAEPGRQAKVSLDIAEYIIQNAVLENLKKAEFYRIGKKKIKFKRIAVILTKNHGYCLIKFIL